ncbi:MAG: IS3 family transposase ISEfa10 [Enterocloster aldenensis]
MAKYSFELKMEVVKAYLNNEGSYTYLAKKYGIPDRKSIRLWVTTYKTLGEKSLLRSRKNEIYTFEFKLHVVELYLSTEVSYQELALSVGMNNPPVITKWVNDFRIIGPDALRPKRKGRRSNVSKPKENIHRTKENQNIKAEYLKQLEDENFKLRLENAYLKELRRLRLEEETLLKKQRELSTASEDTSN